jgi:hypothetical protein
MKSWVISCTMSRQDCGRLRLNKALTVIMMQRSDEECNRQPVYFQFPHRAAAPWNLLSLYLLRFKISSAHDGAKMTSVRYEPEVTG